MATLQEILARAQALREETALGSISPERAGSIMYDTLQQINQMQLEGGSLVISKIYASVSAMEADDAPVSDLTGQALRQGQLVVIVPSDTSSSDLGSVYRYNGTTGGASSWSFTGKIGGYPMDQTPTQGSTRAVTSGGVYEQITQLGQKLPVDVNEEGFYLVDSNYNIGIKFHDGILTIPTKYNGKKISFLGDSITTFGVPDQNNATGTWTYPGNRCRYPQNDLFTDVKYCWWKRLIDKLGANLGINESWAGSRVSNTSATDTGDVGPNRCISSLTRIGHLDDNGTPDIIIVYAGTNDIGNSVTIGTFDTTSPKDLTEAQIASLDVTTFANAYRAMLIRLQYYYRTSRIVVCFPNFTNTYYDMANLDDYIEVIREECDYFGVEYIDLRASGITIYNRTSYLPDGVHPNATGMELLFNKVYNYLIEN